jgi:peptidoglycan/xylan/chitin deacetylase (PgdA/CDA1 family)
MRFDPMSRGTIPWLRYAWSGARFTRVNVPGGVVSFSFDDFPASAAHTAAPMLEKEGWRGTFYLSPGLLNAETRVGTICSLEDVERLSQAGHEIGNHTESHHHCANSPDPVLLEEFERSQRQLKEFPGSRHFAFPAGAYDYPAAGFFSKRFDTSRTVNHGINAVVVDLNLLKANPVYRPVDFTKLAVLLKRTRQLRGWLILYTHDVCATPTNWGCSADEFASVISTVKEAGLAVDTVGSVFRRLKRKD